MVFNLEMKPNANNSYKARMKITLEWLPLQLIINLQQI